MRDQHRSKQELCDEVTGLRKQVADLKAEMVRLEQAGVHFRNDVEVGPGGSQVLIDDPDGNPIELHQP